MAILALTGLATSSIGSANAFVTPAHSVPSVAASSSSSSTSALFVAFGSSSSSGSASDGSSETFASALARGWRPERGSFAGLRRKDRATGTILPMYEDDTGAIMPDGGLSPCVIKVIGVGGGGCNAVSGLLLGVQCICMPRWIVRLGRGVRSDSQNCRLCVWLKETNAKDTGNLMHSQSRQLHLKA